MTTTIATADTRPIAKIALVAGPMRVPDRLGHHDYVGGCALLRSLLGQTEGVEATVVRDGWPADEEEAFAGARAVVLYTGGGKRRALLEPQRLARIQRLVDDGVGLVMIHQAVRFPDALASRAADWVGGAFVAGKSELGHWRCAHREFPEHPVTRGVSPWGRRDGWHDRIQFVEGMRGVTPLVWSRTASARVEDVVSWAYERSHGGGRSFCFTGLDSHFAWAVPGIRQLVVNGILWSAGLAIPEGGAPCAAEAAEIRSYLTPRGSFARRTLSLATRPIKRLVG